MVNPHVLTPDGVRCAWAADAGTIGMADGCGGCGRCNCGNGVWTCCGYCWYHGNEFRALLEMQESRAQYNAGCAQAECDYNEVVLDGPWWTAHLPHIIQAMLIGPADGTGVNGCYGNACVRSMHDIHADFLRTYGLTAADVPLVRYNVGVDFHAA